LSLKNRLMPHVARALSSQRLLEWRRKAFDLARKLTGRKHVLTFYFRPDDPYSYLMAQRLQEFVEHFRLQLKPVTLLYLDDSLYPARDMLDELAPEDAHRLARLHKLEFPDDWAMPDPKAITQAARLLIAHENDPMGYLRLARQSADAIWQGNLERIDYLSRHHDCETSDKAELTLQARREKFLRDGHYLTATIHYAGEWYWSLERLDHLANRLIKLGLGAGVAPHQYDVAKRAKMKKKVPQVAGRTLEMFFSFRSPYSYLALERAWQLADFYQMKLKIRPVLPMVMRGLAVPKAKKFYILKDAAREAALYDVPFGKVADPVGAGVERCMALWPFAEKEQRLREFFLAAGRAIWSDGINVATDRGLARVCADAGLDWNRARRWLADDGWRAEAEHNRDDMMALGCWGVPTFNYYGKAVWGQDRFAVIESLILGETE
jgi:2-hydroxychromene-2-carboxylate isomerase